uniref:fimbrillin family protein n=1 Tax=Prevotella sp. TaxID=59823 RepID=UPI0040264548
MKRNIYSYSKLWMILFVLMGAACTNQVEDAIPVSGQPIEFSVQSDWKEIPNTRLNDAGTQFIQDDQIQIFGLHTSPSGEVKKFMYDVKNPNSGQIVTYDDKSNSWNYTPKRFWPKEGDLLFLASYPQNSIRNDGVNEPMIYEQTDNTFKRDLLWGVSDKDCASAQNRKNNVEITMYHALAKVKIILDKSLGDHIGSVVVSAYKAGSFTNTDGNGIPEWDVPDVAENNISATFYKWGDQKDKDLNENNFVTVFILPKKITRIQMFSDVEPYPKIYDTYPSDEIQKHEFLAGHVYNLTISKSNGVRKKNTNSRSIAMSVRCVSE